MIKFDNVTKENIKEYSLNWSQILDHRYRILIIGVSHPEKQTHLFTLVGQEIDIDKIYLYAKDPNEGKY